MAFMSFPRSAPPAHDPAASDRTSIDLPAPVGASYQAPRLRHLGDFRSLTLGGSLGVGDSGNSGVQRF